MKAVAGAVFCIGLAAFGVLAWVARKLTSLERALDPGDVLIVAVFAAFGAFCAWLGWTLFRSAPGEEQSGREAPSPRRVTLSSGCATAGVLLLMLCGLVPEAWYPGAFLILGIALLAISHALTPCVERIEQLRRARDSLRQL